ncbi:MAG: histidine kinase [Chitinophagaceae bacterium]|nr:histidine kinase [Chitinophagaceae bacterium]
MLRLKDIFQNKLVQHIAFWIAMVILYTINYTLGPGLYPRRYTDAIIYLPGHMFFAYVQMYRLVPRYLLKKKYKLYALYSFLFITISIFYAHMVGTSMMLWKMKVFSSFPTYFIAYGRSAFSLLPSAGLAVAIKLLKEWFHQRENALRAENEKVKIELESLRSQIHPHFLFNTLNNLYSLTLSSSTAASLVVVHLSDLLRYILYECKEPEVPVDKELQMLKKYVELEKLRYGNRLDIGFTTEGNTSQFAISPLLLLPFVENSFKHGVSEQIDQCWINIHVHIHNNAFTFQVSNSRIARTRQPMGGLGMDNTRKRLQLLYDGRHDIKITEESEVYTVKLNLLLNKFSSASVHVNPLLVKKEQPIDAI